MISRIIEYSIRNRFIVLLLTAVVALWGVDRLAKTPVDAIPDLSENQVIVFTDWMGRSPQEIDDQITYPLSVNLQGLSGVKAIRSSSEFNFSMINIIFDEGTDFYFARTRVLERLNIAQTFLPTGVVPYLAPDSTALGQIFWYTVEGDGYSVDELRAIQDWYVRYQLYVSGVAEVASVGGFIREYQIDVDPDKLRAFDIPLGEVFSAVARSNVAVGGKVYFEGNAEFLIRGVGWVRGVADLENVVVTERKGVPIYVRNLAAVQLGPGYRRSMLEKNGHEAVGGVVMMRFGENPLTVTRAVKTRIEQLQPGLPAGVRIVPFYDRTPLIEGAISTLTDTLLEELLVASLAVILILRHLRSALIVCATLPLAVLLAFIFMYYLGIPSNIMSLSGIAISIGLFVDAAVIMVENSTHELTRHFGDQPVRGDITEHVVRACRLVGKPIFFAMAIMLVSFIPVFALGGIEGKMFHPLAWTKTFAMIGVAIAAITFVPAIVPLLVKGRLQREQDNWLVRSFINIYKPVLTWLMNVPAAGIWFMAFLFLIGAGFLGSKLLFLGLLVLSLFFGTVFFRQTRSKCIAFVLLFATAAISWHFPKLGREFMPPLDEGSILDMPVTVPRVSIAQAGEDIRVRDEVMRHFPEVDQVVGKVGRAETPTDPSGIDMVETVVTLRPKAWWPKRKVRFEDVLDEAIRLRRLCSEKGVVSNEARQEFYRAAIRDVQGVIAWLLAHPDSYESKIIGVSDVLDDIEPISKKLRAMHDDAQALAINYDIVFPAAQVVFPAHGFPEGSEKLDRNSAFKLALEILKADLSNAIEQAVESDWERIVNSASMDAVQHTDRTLRDLVYRRRVEHEPFLAKALVLDAVRDVLEHLRGKGALKIEPTAMQIEQLAQSLVAPHGLPLVQVPRREEMTKLIDSAIAGLAKLGAVEPGSDLTLPPDSLWIHVKDAVRTTLGYERATLTSELFKRFESRLDDGWKQHVRLVNYELTDRLARDFVPLLLDKLLDQARSLGLLASEPSDADRNTIVAERGPAFASGTFLWHKLKKDLVLEMDSELQVPGWGNIWTQPIINRVDMLATGVRTMIGVKVFGPRLAEETKEIVENGTPRTITKPGIQTVSNEIASVLRGVRGAVDVFPDQIVGRSYLQIDIDREKAARYGVNVADIQEAIEVAMGGMTVTNTVEGRRRFPIRVRYGRDFRQTQEALRRTLVTGRRGMTEEKEPESGAEGGADAGGEMKESADSQTYQIPISDVADIRVVEGPSVIKSENGMLRAYVQLNVRDRDIVGFVEEAREAVDKKLKSMSGLEGFYIEWSGQFEHQVRARKTLQIIFPIVILLMFVILYMTFNDVRDALLIMLAVPGALIGGVIFQSLFGFNFSVAVWVGYIACFGEATQTGIVMLVYLHDAIDTKGGLKNIRSLEELRQTIVEGAVHRLRPKLITEGVAIIGLMPMLWATGVGAEVMRPMAAPVLGGLLVADEVIDLLLPVIFNWYQARRWRKLHARVDGPILSSSDRLSGGR